jgi:hypothetical protein
MFSVFKCRVYAAECRAIADCVGEARQDALTMAELWERLARETEDAVRRATRYIVGQAP